MSTHQCIQCSKSFQISEADLEFYQKVATPTPTLCPDCRYQRRLVWRNERTLYSRKCDLCHKSLISLYRASSPHTVYCYDCFYSDKWDASTYAQDIDWNKPFFQQMKELQLKVPRLYAYVVNNENSEYTNGSLGNKDCYLIFVSDHNESAMYSYGIYNSHGVLDLLGCNACELCYECIGCSNCFDVKYSEDCSNCNSSAFLIDCTGSSDCFMSYGLRNKKYVWYNQQLTEAEYKAKLASVRLGSANAVERLKQEFADLKKKHTFKYYHGLNNENFSGDYLERVSNSYNCFESYEISDCKYITHGNKIKDCYDGYVVVDQAELGYELAGSYGYNVKFGVAAFGVTNGSYIDTCKQVKDVFGCIGLQNKQFCILNKQYTEVEYQELKAKLIEHMKQTGEWGEFFPINNSPFAYNETAAQDMFPLTQDQVSENGWKWFEPEAAEARYSTYRLADDIEKVKADITTNFLNCSKCKKNYRVVVKELEFYKERGIPVPTQCFDCRHRTRLSSRNPRALWLRQCMCTQTNHGHQGLCKEEFETSYPSESSTLVYCEQCYTKSIN